MRRPWQLFLGFLLLAAVAFGCKPKDTGPGNPTQQLPPGGRTPLPRGGTPPPGGDLPVVAVKLDELIQECKANSKEAETKYADKRVEVTGIVWFAHSDNTARAPMVALTGSLDAKTGLPGNILPCRLDVKDEDRVDLLAKGQTAKVRGLLSAFGAGLAECELLEAGPPTARNVTVDELASAFAGDKEAMETKYHKKPVLVQGPVAEVKWGQQNAFVEFILSGSGDSRLTVMCECQHNPRVREKLQAVQKGQTIKVLGECAASQFSTEVRVESGELLK